MKSLMRITAIALLLVGVAACSSPPPPPPPAPPPAAPPPPPPVAVAPPPVVPPAPRKVVRVHCRVGYHYVKAHKTASGKWIKGRCVRN
jgi:hypothetical protein